jgi:hypothetical protein
MLVLFFSVDELTIRKLTEFYFVLLDKFGMMVARCLYINMQVNPSSATILDRHLQ